jgi:hypothetical protein
MANKKQLMALALSGLIGTVQAGEKEELLKLRNTTTNLIKQLVKQGVITDKAANEMIKQAEVEAGQQVAEAKAAGAKEAVPADEVRVAYVPDFVKDEIRQQVRSELREEVVGDVMQKAKNEQWGLPNALPEWTKRFKLSGDIRLREQSSLMASDNIDNLLTPYYLNYQAINNANNASGAPTRTNLGQNASLNTKKDQNLARERFRLGIDAAVTDGVDAGIRLSSGNTPNPVSTNQTLGNTGARYEFTIDRAFLRYNAVDDHKYNWLTLMGGRTPNPFFTAGSELVWDEDLSFEGLAGSVRQRLAFSELSDDIGGKGPEVFATAGIFPLQAQNPLTGLTSLQKWLFGGQAGLDWGFDNQDSLKLAAAYYDYQNVRAKVNKNAATYCSDSNIADLIQSAPQFTQGGNSMVGICTEGTALNPGIYSGLYGLASDYKILNINAQYDMTFFSPLHLKVSADYAKNIGFSRNRILANTGLDITKQNTAWQFKVDLGWSKIETAGNWNVFAAYKYLERDAVLDAFTDSDFHLGGTNVKGWWLGANYGLMKNVWLTGRWLSGDVIKGPPFGVDVLQVDINTRF